MRLIDASEWVNPPIIAFDMDGCLYKWGERLNEILLSLDPAFPVIDDEERLKFSDLGREGYDLRTLRAAMTHPRMYDGLDLYEGAKEAVEATYRAGYRVVFLSTPEADNTECAGNKQAQIRRDFGSDAVKHLILSHDKTIVNVDVLVDDKPEITGYATPSWIRVMPDHSWNRYVNSPLRMPNWDCWPEYLEKALTVRAGA